MSYWDSSALVKLYVNEADSITSEELALNATSRPVIGRIGIYEIQTALRRKETEGAIADGGAKEIIARLLNDCTEGNLHVVEFGADVERKFEEVLTRAFQKTGPQVVRTSDAIHLASALVASESEIIATDKQLRNAAVGIGLRALP